MVRQNPHHIRDQVRPGIWQVHEAVHSVGQEPGRKHDFLEQEGPMKRGVGPVIGPHKSHFIVLYIINPQKNFNKGSRIHSFKGIMMSRPQGLSLPAALPWPQLFTSILVAIYLIAPIQALSRYSNECRRERRDPSSHSRPEPNSKTEPCAWVSHIHFWTWVHAKTKGQTSLDNETHSTYYKSKTPQPSLTRELQKSQPRAVTVLPLKAYSSYKNDPINLA